MLLVGECLVTVQILARDTLVVVVLRLDGIVRVGPGPLRLESNSKVHESVPGPRSRSYHYAASIIVTFYSCSKELSLIYTHPTHLRQPRDVEPKRTAWSTGPKNHQINRSDPPGVPKHSKGAATVISGPTAIPNPT